MKRNKLGCENINLFIFGSTGDLVKRKVLPALNKLNLKHLQIFAIGRRDFVNELYLDFSCKEDCLIKNNIHYFKTTFETDNICKECEENLNKYEINYFYISLPPKLYKNVFKKLKKIKDLNFKIKILIEKPFGNSLKEAKALLCLLKKYKLDKNILINDHYLFKKEILNLKKQKFKNIQIIALEKLGLEGRISYYDDTGALNDMIQSHLLNILFKLLTKEEINDLNVISYQKKQYQEYKQELGKKSNTETFAHVKLKTNNKTIDLITGKKFLKKRTYIKLDNLKINITDEETYINILKSFLNNKKTNFVRIENVIKAWEIIEKIKMKENNINLYPSNLSFNQFKEKYLM